MEALEESIVPVVFLLFLAAIILLPKYLRSRERQKLMDTVRLAYERGQPAPVELIASVLGRQDAEPSPELVEAVVNGGARRPAPDRDLRRGAILLAIAVAIAAFGGALAFTDGADGSWPLVGIAAFPGFLGLTFIALWLIERRRG